MAYKICTNCYFEGKPKKHMAGSFLIEVVLWICMFIPGFIYTVWRNTSGVSYHCAQCKSDRLMNPKEFSDMMERQKKINSIVREIS